MAHATTTRLAICVAVVALAGTAAAIRPAEARADAGPVDGSEPTVSLPAVDLDPLASGAAENAGEGTIVESPGPTTDGGGEEHVTGSTGTDATPVTTAPAEPTPPPLPGGTDASASLDTTPIPADITVGIREPGPSVVESPSTPAQPVGTNVNVSIRIGSPGDDGAVAQLNVVSALPLPVPTAAPAANVTAEATSPAAAISPPKPTPDVSTVPQGSHPTGGAPIDGQDDPGTWSWRWDCVSEPDMNVISQLGSTRGSGPQNWDWIWDCGENAGQYQMRTSPQYRVENINVSIRIASPGGNGAVSQTNVEAAAGTARASATATPGTGLARAAVALVAADVSRPSVQGAGTGPPGVVLAPNDPGSTGMSIDVTPDPEQPAELVSVESALELAFGAVDFRATFPTALVPIVTGAEQAPGWGRPHGTAARSPIALAAHPRSTVLPPAWTAAAVAVKAARYHRPGSAEPVRNRVTDVKEGPRPRWRVPRPIPPPEVAPAGASAAPATGGGSFGGGIPIFLALPFLAAILDLARRVALSRVALPSGYRDRMPERPG